MVKTFKKEKNKSIHYKKDIKYCIGSTNIGCSENYFAPDINFYTGN